MQRMHTLIKSLPALYIASAISTLVMLGSVSAAEPTAFELIKEGNRYVGEQSKDKVVQIRSEKSVASKFPNIWFIVFFDPTATLKATEVKFGAGKMLSVKRPMRLLEIAGSDLPLDRDKLKIDSDAAIKAALAEPLLNNIEVTATQLKLERVSQGVLGVDSTGEAAWKIKLWAAKIRDPRREASLGEVWVSASDGKVVKTDLHLNRLD